MDPFSLTVGVIGILTAAQSCIKTIKKHIGPSATSSEEMQNMMKTLWGIIGVMSSFKTYQELHDDEDDDDRIASLEHLQPVIDRSTEAIQTIKNYLSSGRRERFVHGVKFDKKLKLAQKSLDDASKLFNMALVSNQHTIVVEVKKYVQAISDEVKGVQAAQINAQQDHAYSHVIGWLDAKSDNNLNSQIHERNIATRESNSGEWLLNHATFQDWLTNGEATKSKVWLTGSPGAGKSCLCSMAIQHVTKTLRGICLYYFYRFDDQSESGNSSGVKAATALVDQLFRYFCRRDQRIAIHVSDYVRTEEKNMNSLVETARLIIKHGQGCGKDDSDTAAAERVAIHYFLDGVDEERGEHAAKTITELLHGLDKDLPVTAKVWISSRRTNILENHLEGYTVINADDHAKADVEGFLLRTVPKFDENWQRDEMVEDKPIGEWVMQKVREKARGNFLYARLMVEWLKDGVFTIDDVTAFIESRVPNHFTAIYDRIFERYYRKGPHKYISLLFSLIAFARRPLRLHELREAMALALADPTKGVNPRSVPNNLQRLFAPLIEMQKDPIDQGNSLCRLCHSTVREFLSENPGVLQAGAQGQVSPVSVITASRVGHIYLRYLSQARYSTPVDLPHDGCHGAPALSYDDAQQHGLLPYSAKYWHRHFDDVEQTPGNREELIDFLKSSNFKTLIQVQSLFVWGQFVQFRNRESITLATPWYQRAIPWWFGLDKASRDAEYLKESHKIRRDYRHFSHEWGHLLRLGTCQFSGSGKCLTEHFWGEVDRCLTGLLGPTHFMNQVKERYSSFMLTSEPYECDVSEQFIIGDTVSASGTEVCIMSSPSKKSSEVSLEIWDLESPNQPRSVLNTPVTTANIDFKSDTARPIAFSHTIAKFLSNKIDGDALFILDQHTAQQNFEPLSTDFDMRDGIVVIASRNVHKQRPKKKFRSTNVSARKTIETIQDWDCDSSGDESSDESDDGYSSSSADENSANETCSDGSTDSESGESADDMSETVIESDQWYVESSKEDEDEEKSDLDSSDDEADPSTTGAQRRELMSRPKQLTDSELELGNESLRRKRDDRPTYPGIPGRFREPNDRIIASIAVYDRRLGQNIRMFHYEHETPATCMMYHSPPALHPRKSLVVWPLGGGEILFADYVEKTYFIRATMPTTSDTRHICMKTRFSSDGSCLHIASVEGRLLNPRVESSTAPNGSKAKEPEIVLSLFLTTHRLSSQKTTRSPPRLIHKVKLTIGQFTGLSLARLPFTFTWTSEHLNFTVSGIRLNVFRVNLFRQSTSPTTASVFTPRLPVMLPLSASGRQVYYLPPTKTERREGRRSRGVVLLGSYCPGTQPVELNHRSKRAARRGMGSEPDYWLYDYSCPAAGLFVDEESDLGGWIALEDDGEEDEGLGVTATAGGGERFRDGKLTRKIEAFNWRDDVDLEGICDRCKRPLGFR